MLVGNINGGEIPSAFRAKKNPELKDSRPISSSGKEENFSSGSVRDDSTGKGRPELISPIFIKRLAQHLERGAARYKKRNWELGQNLERYMASLKRHTDQFLEGERGPNYEDHLAAIAFNVMGLIHTEEMINRGLLPKELDDLPNYIKKEV